MRRIGTLKKLVNVVRTESILGSICSLIPLPWNFRAWGMYCEKCSFSFIYLLCAHVDSIQTLKLKHAQFFLGTTLLPASPGNEVGFSVGPGHRPREFQCLRIKRTNGKFSPAKNMVLHWRASKCAKKIEQRECLLINRIFHPVHAVSDIKGSRDVVLHYVGILEKLARMTFGGSTV